MKQYHRHYVLGVKSYSGDNSIPELLLQDTNSNNWPDSKALLFVNVIPIIFSGVFDIPSFSRWWYPSIYTHIITYPCNALGKKFSLAVPVTEVHMEQ